jgi:hypothetical protein
LLERAGLRQIDEVVSALRPEPKALVRAVEEAAEVLGLPSGPMSRRADE